MAVHVRAKSPADPLVHAFLETDGVAHPAAESDDGEKSDDFDDADEPSAEAAKEVWKLLDPYSKADPFRLRLYGDVIIAVEAMAGLQPSRSGFRGAVMTWLREQGYNAGVCKARWEGSKGMAGGNYEYIDVEVDNNRYIVDVDFASEFKVARPTEGYKKLAAAMPAVVVARSGEVLRAVRIAAYAARRSLRRQGLSVPPWRKRRFMIAKWLGPYRRTVNPLTASEGLAVARGEVKCRAVGFAPAPEKVSIGESKPL